ncbi:unnamed protein product [Dracunculus medinensis]|uniref:Glyco_hydro_38C domain-containing protein n=1 Tax=Dracunculus medinensis TaxID=318479 RepID=A0A158Q5L5_DRAME|nr:unnamed protein product [Dracunculus medinensis]
MWRSPIHGDYQFWLGYTSNYSFSDYRPPRNQIGTAKENVTKDYKYRLSKGLDQAEVCEKFLSFNVRPVMDYFQEVINKALTKIVRIGNGTIKFPEQVICRLINESICDITRKYSNFAIIVLNGNTRPYQSVIRVPYYHKCASVFDQKGKILPFQMNEVFIKSEQAATYELLIPVEIPAMGFATIFVVQKTNLINEMRCFKKSTSSPKLSFSQKTELKLKINENSFRIKNKFIELEFDTRGYLSSIQNLESGSISVLKQEFLIYHGTGISNTTNQPSGAYIFRPNGTISFPIASNITYNVVEGEMVSEVRQILNPWVTQIIRLYKTRPFVEFEWTVGPIPKEKADLKQSRLRDPEKSSFYEQSAIYIMECYRTCVADL